MVKYYSQFLKKLEIFSPYLIEFCKDNSIKLKLYPLGGAVNGFKKRLVIFITHDKYSFFANNNQYLA